MTKKDIIAKFKDITNQTIPIDDKISGDPSKLDWQRFENVARKAIENELDTILNGGKININGKAKDFDLLNIDENIVGDVKHYKMTEGGNNPSAKFSVLNEYSWLMQKLEQYQKQKWQKIFVVGEDVRVAGVPGADGISEIKTGVEKVLKWYRRA
ncbi:MAG: hypothetical protein HOD60_10950 [Candidatus Nitrosopelagicus sp.]|nr:hypothetical protein [Candidatus Nitrosopelagicus sp.]